MNNTTASVYISTAAHSRLWVGSFMTPAGRVDYVSYPDYVTKIEAAFKQALLGWNK